MIKSYKKITAVVATAGVKDENGNEFSEGLLKEFAEINSEQYSYNEKTKQLIVEIEIEVNLELEKRMKEISKKFSTSSK